MARTRKKKEELTNLKFLFFCTMQRATNFAEALFSCNHPPPAKKIAKKRDLNTKKSVLADLSSGETQRQVAQKHGISERLVRRIKHIAKKSQEEKVDWYRMRMDDVLSSIDPHNTHNMESDPPTTYTTNLEAETARIITADELNKHLIQGETEKSKKDYVRARIVNETSKDSFHGFFIVDDSGSTGSVSITLEKKQRDWLDRILAEEVPKVLAKVKDYEKCFSPIFEYAQDAPLAAGEKRGSEAEEVDKRMGDKQRMQAKLSSLMEVAATRLQEAKAKVGKNGASSKAGRRASSALKAAQKEDALFTELYNLMCAKYECIRKVWPEPVRKGQDDAANYAIIRSFPKARSQGIHGDSEHRGFSILTAVGRQQYLVVVLNGFRAMRIYEKLVVDRAAATSLFRQRFEALPGQRSFSETEWANVEPRVWGALVHKEFEVQRLPPFEAVRVPISKGASIVLDTRCLHGGGPGDDLIGFRAHAYGTVRPSGPASSCTDALEKDYLTTVDILNEDNYPVGTWGTRSGLWG